MQHTYSIYKHPCIHPRTLRLHFPAPVNPLHRVNAHTPYTECLLNQQCHRTISVDWLLGWYGGKCQSAVSPIIANKQKCSPVCISYGDTNGATFLRYPCPIMPFCVRACVQLLACEVCLCVCECVSGEMGCQLVCHGNGKHV